MFGLENLCSLCLTTTVNTSSASSSFWLTVVDVAVPSLSGLIGVVLGAALTSKSTRKQIRSKLLSEAYPEIFHAYTEFVKSRGKETLLDFVAASEKAMLFCSPNAEKILMAMRYEMSDEDPDGTKCAALLDMLRKEAKKDIDANVK